MARNKVFRNPIPLESWPRRGQALELGHWQSRGTDPKIWSRFRGTWHGKVSFAWGFGGVGPALGFALRLATLLR
jgi:hypothetical protein